MVASLINGYDDGLKLGFKDRLHQPYRGTLIKGYDEIMAALEKDEHVITACAVNGGDKIYAIITNYNSDSKNIVECSDGKKKVIKKLEIEDNYYPLKYFDNKLYYYFFNRESDKSGIVLLD